MDVDSRIKRYFAKVVAEEIDDDDDIFALGIVNSLFAIQLITFVESEFSISVERGDLDIDNFCSIAALTKFVRGKVEGVTVPGSGHERPD
jgi:methoxymalonate biosynthesis acyl carrier protein